VADALVNGEAPDVADISTKQLVYFTMVDFDDRGAGLA
jgi:hypothetical protein